MWTTIWSRRLNEPATVIDRAGCDGPGETGHGDEPG